MDGVHIFMALAAERRRGAGWTLNDCPRFGPLSTVFRQMSARLMCFVLCRLSLMGDFALLFEPETIVAINCDGWRSQVLVRDFFSHLCKVQINSWKKYKRQFCICFERFSSSPFSSVNLLFLFCFTLFSLVLIRSTICFNQKNQQGMIRGLLMCCQRTRNSRARKIISTDSFENSVRLEIIHGTLRWTITRGLESAHYDHIT